MFVLSGLVAVCELSCYADPGTHGPAEQGCNPAAEHEYHTGQLAAAQSIFPEACKPAAMVRTSS